MNPNCIYEVKTYWGYFRLDEGAYEDYLKGKLWITWVPGRPQPALETSTERLTNVSERAIKLRDEVAKSDAYAMACSLCRVERIRLPYKAKLRDVSIDEMCLSVRSSNGLMRSGTDTFGKIAELMEREQGLRSVRNLGVKSEQEITRHFFLACYSHLTQTERAVFWQSVLDEQTAQIDLQHTI